MITDYVLSKWYDLMVARKGRQPHVVETITRPPALTSIRFPCVYQTKLLETHFKLGLGSCGKVVTKLAFVETDKTYTILQTTEDGERKEFIYQRDHIVGRIETIWN